MKKIVIHDDPSTWPPEDTKLLFVVERNDEETDYETEMIEVVGTITCLDVNTSNDYDEDEETYCPVVEMDEEQHITKEDKSWIYAIIISWQRIEGAQP